MEVPEPKTQMKKVVKVKQQNKMPEQPTQKGGPSMQDLMNFIAETSKKQEERINEKLDQNKEELFKKLDSINNIFKPVEETQDTTSEGSKEIEFKKDQSVLSPENNNNETNDECVEMKTEKRHHRKIIKTREEVEMMKNGLTDVFNVPMTNHAERMNFMECRRTLKEILEGVKYLSLIHI